MNKTEKVIGYTQGVYDLFHIGHLNILRKAREKCDYLIVGVNSDDLTEQYKLKRPIVPEEERLEIVKSIKYVDKAVIAKTHDKLDAYKMFHYDVIFVGSDHQGESKWLELEEHLAGYNSRVEYLPYTQHTSSTKLREALDETLEHKKA